MTTRFYFDLTNGPNTLRDDEGVEASSLDEATGQAQAAMDDMRSKDEAPTQGEGWQLIIRDESGVTLKAISLDDVAFH